MERTDYYFDIQRDGKSFVAYNSDNIKSLGYSAKFVRIFTRDFKWDKFNAHFYSDGQVKDIVINGWSFKPVINGFHRVYPVMDPRAPEFTIEGHDPKNNPFEFQIYTFGFFREAAKDYMNSLLLYSKFPDSTTAQLYNKLINVHNRHEIDKHCMIKIVRELKTFYLEQIKLPNHDVAFLNEIKKTLNEAIILYVKGLNVYQITED